MGDSDVMGCRKNQQTAEGAELAPSLGVSHSYATDSLVIAHTLCRSLREMPLLGDLSEKLPARKRLGDRTIRSPASTSSPLLGAGGMTSCG